MKLPIFFTYIVLTYLNFESTSIFKKKKKKKFESTSAIGHVGKFTQISNLFKTRYAKVSVRFVHILFYMKTSIFI